MKTMKNVKSMKKSQEFFFMSFIPLHVLHVCFDLILNRWRARYPLD